MIKENIFLTPVDSLEVKNIILSLKNSATGHDDIGASLLKLSIEHIAAPLTHICNLSLSEGVFPDQLKIANVVPLYIAEDSMMFNNYRPVSVLCVLSKIFKKIMFTRVQVFLNELQILYKYQFGFRKGHSTYMTHIVSMDKLIHAMENGEYVVARVRGDPPLLQSAMDILWRLRFSRLRQAPSRKAWYRRGPVKSKIIASYVHENFYLWYLILPQIMVFPCSINITARLACTNNHTCSTDPLARLIIGFKSTK